MELLTQQAAGKPSSPICDSACADICDPLSENPAHPAFYDNRDKTGNRHIDV